MEDRLTNRWESFQQAMRYTVVIGATLVLIVMAIVRLVFEENMDLVLLLFFMVLAQFFFLSIPAAALWIYSFIKSLWRSTKTDKILLYFHVADILLIAYLFFSKPDCDADIMAEHYEKYADEMHNVVEQTRRMLPDSTSLVIEFGSQDYMAETDLLDNSQKENLRQSLEDIGCIGIEVDKCGDRGYATLRFRRIGMGMYSFMLFDKPLLTAQRDSINDDYRMLFYNDSTAFEYGGGAIGNQRFLGKEEFLEKLSAKEP